MTRQRKQQLLLIAIAVLITHLALTTGLALAGEWRVWRFVTDFIAHLYGWVAIIWLTVQIRSEVAGGKREARVSARASRI